MLDGIMSRAVGVAQRVARQVTAPVQRVVLTRRGFEPVDLTGLVGLGETDADVVSDDEVITTVRMLDALIKVSDYKIDDNAVEPQRLDVLTITTAGGEDLVYVVHAEPPDKPWRHADRFQRQYRVHLKRKR